MIVFMGYWWTIKIKIFCYFISKRGLKGPKIRNFTYLVRIFNIWNNKTRQMSKIQWVQHITESNTLSYPQFTEWSKILCSHLILIYTCSTFPCWHTTVVSCFALHSPLFPELPSVFISRDMTKYVEYCSSYNFMLQEVICH